MRATRLSGTLWLLLAVAACGKEEAEPREPPMAVEETVFGDLVGTQDKARDRTEAAIDEHRQALESGLEAAEGTAPEE